MRETNYMMDARAEGERLEAKTDHALTQAQLQLTGLTAGMRALDVGAGTGAVSRDMARLVGAHGHVTAFDGSAERLEMGRALAAREGLDNLAFVQGNAYELDLPAGGFDYTWARFFLEYLDRPQVAIGRMVAATRGGGTVALADIDGNCVWHYPASSALQQGLEALAVGLRGRFDPDVGRKLFTFLRQQPQIEDVRLDVRPYHLIAGAIDPERLSHWKLKLRNFRGAAAAAMGPAEFDAWERAFLAHLEDPDTLTYSVLFTAWGRKRQG